MSDPTADLSGNALFIGGEWRKPEDGSIGVVISPSTEHVSRFCFRPPRR